MKVKEWDVNYRIALGITLLLLVWMILGLIPHEADEETAPGAHANDFTVQVAPSQAQPYKRPIYVRAVTEANRSVLVSAEVDGLVEATPAHEGGVVEKGAPLCRLASEDRELRLQQAKAELNKAQIEYKGALSLNNQGLQSQTQIATAKANLALTEAEVAARELAVEKLVVRAPFAGTVQEQLVDVGGYIQRGAACARMLELSPLVVTGEIAEKDVIHLGEGDAATVNFRNGRSEQGRVSYLSSAANPSTRTFKIDVNLPNEDRSLVEGLSAELVIASHSVQAHRISPSLLSLLSDGSLAIKVIEDTDLAVEKVVTIVGDDDKGVWVTGLPDTVSLISVGHEYVANNSRVKFTPAKPPSTQQSNDMPAQETPEGKLQGDTP